LCVRFIGVNVRDANSEAVAFLRRYQITYPNLDDPDDGTEGVDLVPHVAKKRVVKAALNNSFGFGGTNASLIMKAFVE